jgi:glycosyltransferase involved in cell wall biosynthesis
MAPEKNLDYLSRAITAFMEDRPDSRFLVVGDGPRRLDIQRHFERSDRADRLILAGELSRPYLADAYNAMDLFVFASKCETQGMVLVEVMAAGKPVIALDAFGCREVVVDGKNSRLLSENADEKEFARTVAAFFDHPEKRRRWSARVGETAADFSREVCARELAKVYRAAGADTEKRLDSGPQEQSV